MFMVYVTHTQYRIQEGGLALRGDCFLALSIGSLLLRAGGVSVLGGVGINALLKGVSSSRLATGDSLGLSRYSKSSRRRESFLIRSSGVLI